MEFMLIVKTIVVYHYLVQIVLHALLMNVKLALMETLFTEHLGNRNAHVLLDNTTMQVFVLIALAVVFVL